ncbi:hypothetical protein IFM89_027017 [Coptis chinensis]|uniref:Uncharacterized protein n=1 Tax=Coptis chinensis TaxID=261450 RepID=A0A835I6P1_9MAGN|nr:hypothetical protein IFM89_027017 [Coptis chinensis]
MTKPWCVCGDFNSILSSVERYGCAPVHPRDMEDFIDCVNSTGLVDLQFTGSYFTWTNNSEASEASFLLQGVSDHTPIVLSWFDMPKSLYPFRFCNAWALHNSFHEVVNNAWEQTIGGNPILVLNVKLKRLKGVLKDWLKTNFSDIHARTEGARDILFSIQTELQS